MRECGFAKLDGWGAGIGEPSALTHSVSPETSSLGGKRLTVVALARTESGRPGATTAAGRQDFAMFGRQFMKWNGEFGPRDVPRQGGLQTAGDVLDDPGEMVLGWMALFERHLAPELRQWSLDALMRLVRERPAAGAVSADHWSLRSQGVL